MLQSHGPSRGTSAHVSFPPAHGSKLCSVLPLGTSICGCRTAPSRGELEPLGSLLQTFSLPTLLLTSPGSPRLPPQTEGPRAACGTVLPPSWGLSQAGARLLLSCPNMSILPLLLLLVWLCPCPHASRCTRVPMHLTAPVSPSASLHPYLHAPCCACSRGNSSPLCGLEGQGFCMWAARRRALLFHSP